MAKRSNNSLGRRSYGGKPYDANNSFVKKMATKVTDLIPQRSWISKWFNASQDNIEASNDSDDDGNLSASESQTHQPPAKRPRIRMDVTHPPGTFSIKARDKGSSNNHDSRLANETEEYFHEPAIAGPSGVCKFVSSTPAIREDVRNSNSPKSRQMSHVTTVNNGASNGADDNSESGESTSGCSSLVPQTNRQDGAPNSMYGSSLGGGRNRFIDEKSFFANNPQSPRCLFLESVGSRESLSSRRPSFNASMMSNSGNNFERSSSLSSPFYSGNVTFGGANALGSYKRSRSLFNGNNEFQLKIPRRTSVQVKPSSSETIDSSGMSQTAKRILEAMEHFSSPISDAKKIPVKENVEFSAGRKRFRDERSVASVSTSRVGLRHLTRELAVPTIPEMLKLRRRQKLQDTTVAARKIISAMSVPAPSSSTWSATTTTTTMTTTTTTTTTTTKTTMTTLAEAPTAAISEDYHLRTELDQSPKYQGKLRGKLNKSPDYEGPAPTVNLPSISLTITSLPSFEPLPIYTVPPISSSLKDVAATTNENCDYKFASPIKITEATWNLKSINNFSFSKPINASETTNSGTLSEPATTRLREDSKLSGDTRDDAVATNFMWSGSSTAPRLRARTKQQRESPSEKTENTIFDSSTTKEMDKLKSSAADTGISISSSNERGREIWECSECYIKNDTRENTCVACKASKPRVTDTRDDISRLSGTILNDPGTSSMKFKTRKNVPAEMGFGSQYKINVDQWDCESCLVRNKIIDQKCVSCSSPRSSTASKQSVDPTTSSVKTASKHDLAEKFKPAEGSWECSGCMLRNPSSVIKCPCCSTGKPGPSKGSPKKTSSTAITTVETKKRPVTRKNDEENTKLMDKFKPAAGSWECSSCMVRNDEISSVCVCCSNPKPGVAGKSARDTVPRVDNESGWGDKFKKPEGSWSCESCMLQNKSESNECVACSAAKPGVTKKSQTAASQFSFGIPANDQTFKFGIDKAESIKSKDTPSSDIANGFAFGSKSMRSNVNSGQFTFGIPKESEKIEKIEKSSSNPIGGFVFASPNATNDSGPKFETNSSNEIARETKKSENDETCNSMTFVFGTAKTANKRSAPVAEDTTREDSDEGARINSVKRQFVFGAGRSHENPISEAKSIFNVSTSDKPSIFGNRSQTTTSNESSSLAAPKSSDAIVEEQHGKSIPSSVTSPSTNISTQARTPFTFADPKTKITSQPSLIAPIFGQTAVSSSPSTFTIDGSIANRETCLNSTEKTNKPLASNFGIHNSSTGFGIVSPSGTPTILPDTSNVEANASFAPVEKAKSSFFAVPGDNKAPPTFAAPTMEKTSQIFGNPDNKLLSSSAFGSNDKPIATNTMFNSAASSATSFGLNSAATTQSLFGNSETPVFGRNTGTPSFASGGNVGSSNMFATSEKSNVTTAPASNPAGLFSFGGASSQRIPVQTNPPTFSFVADTGDSANSAGKPIFGFNNSVATRQIAGEGFGTAGTNTGAFGAPASTLANPSSSPFTFNAPSAKQDPPAFGQTTSTIPNMFGTQQVSSGIGQQAPNPSTFGTNAAPSSTGFSFGAAAPPTLSGGFNFGGAMAQPPATPSGGFNFNAPSASPAIAFDPNTRPSFNFTGGTAPTAFNATPQPVGTTRKIKKAVRRIPQQR